MFKAGVVLVVKVIEGDRFEKLCGINGIKSMDAPAQGCAKKVAPAAPSPKGAGGAGVGSGKVIIVVHTHAGPEIKNKNG